MPGGPDAAEIAPIATMPELRRFLRHYHEYILAPLELPAIHRAYGHARRHEVRELVAFDQELSGEPLLRSLASASRQVGQVQLQRLRPLRDDRTVQRYLAEVDRGAAQGWYTLVYGLTLAVYSLPLRQGLLGYAELTTWSFVQSAARSLDISKADIRALFEELSSSLPGAVEAVLARELVAEA